MKHRTKTQAGRKERVPPHSSPAAQARDRRWVWLLLPAALLALSACTGTRVQPVFCAEKRLNLALDLYDKAREQLAIHYRQRSDSTLGTAFRASQDAVILARSSRNCLDFDEVTRRQAIDLIRTNLLFQKLVVSNMRDQDPGVVIDLYGARYREIFKNDIQ